MNATAALARIHADLARHKNLFDLARGDLGRKLCKAATDGVQYSIAREEAPDGSRWADLSTAYEEWKSFRHPGNPIAVLEGTMANPREVAGEVEVAPHRAAVTYGVSDRAKQEAVWFQEGSARQPPRPFFGLTPEAVKEARSLLDDRFREA
jgi:phage gpG-like protein